MSPVIAGLFIHPVKSAAAIECDSVVLATHGFEHDREWMIVDPAGRFLTQREEARLALLVPAIEAGRLRLSNPEGEGPALALDHEGVSCEVQVWRSRCAAFDAGDAVAQFLSDWLGRPLRLVRFDPRHARYSDPQWTAGRQVPTMFPDSGALLVLSQASLDDLSARVGQQLPPQRFRANLLLGGALPAYAEDSAATLQAGEVRIQLAKPCTRCVITTIDHRSGERTGVEPLRTLKSYRFDRALGGVVFGRNAHAVAGVGTTLRRGMPVTLAD